MYQKILVPYDGSKPSDRALDHAVSNSKLTGGKTEVILLHVIAEYPVSTYARRPVCSINTGQITTLSQYIKEVYDLMTVNTMDSLKMKKEEVKRSTNSEITIKVLQVMFQIQ
jgi:nucleotide-binding universal stress UspA family protein